MLSCDAGTACSLVLLQVSTATAGTKSQGHPTRATPTTPNSTHPTETMATSGQPTRAGRSQAVVEVGVVGGGAREVTKEVGRDRKRPENDGNFNINRTNRVTGASPVGPGSGGGDTALVEQSGSGSTTPTQGQGQVQRNRAQQDKPFSYAQALKTKSSPFSKPPSAEGGGGYRAPSSKMSSRSQTPSESSLLGGKEGVIMKGAPPHAGGNHASVEDSLDFELRSSSALSITTASDSVTSDRSASRQSLPLDASSQRGEEECGVKPAFDTRTEKSDYDDSEGITFMGPQLDYEQVERSPIAPPPMMTSDPSPPTNQLRASSPAARSASPVNITTITVNHPSATEYANQHPGQRSAPPTQQSTQQSPSAQNQKDKATSFIERRAPPHSPAALSPVPPPGLSPNKEHQFKSPGASPHHPSMAGETNPSIGAQAEAFKVLQQLEHTPSSGGLGDNETDSSNKNVQPPPDSRDAAILLPSSHKPSPSSSSEGGKESLMFPLPMDRSPLAQQQQSTDLGSGGGPGVLPNPIPSLAAPHMTSILPHPPTNSQMGFASTPPHAQQAHLPLRPPGQSGSS